MSQFTIKFSFTVFVSAPSQKQNNCLEKEPKENSDGYSRYLKLSAICQLANPCLQLYLGHGFFGQRQDRCQGLADGTVVLHYYLLEQYLQAHFTQVHHTFWRHKQEPSRLLGGMGLTSQGGLISEWSPCYSKKNKARRQPPSTLQTLCPTPGHS